MSYLVDWLAAFSSGPLGAFGPMLEMAFLAAVFYVLLGFVRGTRGAGVARGLAAFVVLLLLALMVVVHWLRLDNVAWLLEQFVATLGVGVIVIFQPEIRQALVKMGETFRMFGAQTATIDKEIADAAVQIAKKGDVGALIVLERETPLGGYAESGVRLDAELNAPLLRTIFTKNTPLHDGAVVVRQGRVVAANCLLPLSENVEACRGMGTRHRAAIGLSEQTDAVTVVVSEETGAISAAMGGRIHRDLDYERLRAFLRDNVGTLSVRPKDAMASSPDARAGDDA